MFNNTNGKDSGAFFAELCTATTMALTFIKHKFCYFE